MNNSWIIVILLLLAACNPGASTPLVQPPPTLGASPTPSPTLTLEATPTPTQLPSITPTPRLVEYPTQAAHPGLVAVTHPRIPDFVFLVDPLQWELRPILDPGSKDGLFFLRNTTMETCELRAPIIGGIPAPDRFYGRVIGNHAFTIFDFSSTALYGTASLVTHEQQYLELFGTDDPTCMTALWYILEEMEEAAVFNGDQPPVSLAINPPPPTPTGYECNSLMPRLKAGDQAFFVADSLWLRTEPRRAVETEIRLLARYAPYVIEIKDGPVCGDEHTFWAVEMYQVGEGEYEIYTGWIAESDPQEYLLEELP